MRSLFVIVSIVFLFVSCDNGDDNKDPQTDTNPLIGAWVDNVYGEKQYTFIDDSRAIRHLPGFYSDGSSLDYPGTYTFNGEWVVEVADGTEAVYRYYKLFYDKDKKRLYPMFQSYDNSDVPPDDFDPESLTRYYTKRK
jgi:hypothetical protein